jgi:hypothetical protein
MPKQCNAVASAPEAKPFVVLCWGSPPTENNDDCWTGVDYATLAEAEDAFAAPVTGVDARDTHTVELSGPGVYRTRLNPGFSPEPDDCDDWKRERAMQAGMSFCCDGYNDEMGY